MSDHTETLKVLVEAVTLLLAEQEQASDFPGQPFEPYPRQGWYNVRRALFEAADTNGLT